MLFFSSFAGAIVTISYAFNYAFNYAFEPVNRRVNVTDADIYISLAGIQL